MTQYLEWILRLLHVWYNTITSSVIVPTVNTGTNASPANITGTYTNCYFYKLTALGGNAVIASAADMNGVTVSGLAGKTILQGDSLEFPISTYTLTSGAMIEYRRIADINIPV